MPDPQAVPQEEDHKTVASVDREVASVAKEEALEEDREEASVEDKGEASVEDQEEGSVEAEVDSEEDEGRSFCKLHSFVHSRLEIDLYFTVEVAAFIIVNLAFVISSLISLPLITCLIGNRSFICLFSFYQYLLIHIKNRKYQSVID